MDLAPNGFNYNIGIDIPIVIYGKEEAIKKLQQSISFDNNIPSTVEKVIAM